MTAVRKSFAIAPETGEIGSGVARDNIFYALPYGNFVTHSARRETESIFGTGSKKRQTATYGRFDGTWQLDYVFDYNQIYILEMIMDGHLVRKLSQTDSGGHYLYEHKFIKDNASRVKHFVGAVKILNEIAGGDEGSDECTIFKGMVAKTLTLTVTMSNSKMAISISGIYSDQETRLGVLTSTDYAQPTGKVSQYGCMFMDALQNDKYVKDVDQYSITIDLTTGLIHNTCSPIATQYLEDRTQFSWNAQTYSNNPQKKFQLRPNSGGKDSDHMRPAAKDVGPMAKAYFVSYSESVRDNSSYSGLVEAINGSENFIEIEAVDSTVATMTWPNGNGQKLMDILSSIECSEIIITIRTHTGPPASTPELVADAQEFTKVATGEWGASIQQTVTSVEGTTPGGWSNQVFVPFHVTNQSETIGGSAVSVSMAAGVNFYANPREKYNIKSGMLKLIEEGDEAATLATKTIEGWMILPKSMQTSQTGQTYTLDSLTENVLSDKGLITDTGVTVANEFVKTTTIVDPSNPSTVVEEIYVPKITFSGTTVTWPSGVTDPRITEMYYAVKGTISKKGTTYILTVEDHGIVKLWIDRVTTAEEESSTHTESGGDNTGGDNTGSEGEGE